MTKCKHCGREIRPGEVGVDRDWIHVIGFYQCPGAWGVFAEPESAVQDHNEQEQR